MKLARSQIINRLKNQPIKSISTFTKTSSSVLSFQIETNQQQTNNSKFPVTGLDLYRNYSTTVDNHHRHHQHQHQHQSNQNQNQNQSNQQHQQHQHDHDHTPIQKQSHNTHTKAMIHNALIESYASQPTTPLTISHLIESGRKKSKEYILEHSKLIQKELPIRMAQLIKNFQLLPYIVGINPYVKSINQLYTRSFDDLVSFPPIATHEEEVKYTEMLKRLVEEHTNVIPVLSKGMHECRKYFQKEALNSFLDTIIKERIGIRVLAEQHIALHESCSPNRVGVIDTLVKPADVFAEAATRSQELCSLNYGEYPEVELKGDVDCSFPYILAHLQYISFELLKNSMRATVEWSRKNNKKLEPITITIGKGSKDITIRIQDRGGGIPPQILPQIWDYSFTTVNHDGDENNHNIFAVQTQLDVQSTTGGPMAGFGYGLPTCQIYTQHFGGSIQLVSMYGYGCDTFIRLRHLGGASLFENLHL